MFEQVVFCCYRYGNYAKYETILCAFSSVVHLKGNLVNTVCHAPYISISRSVYILLISYITIFQGKLKKMPYNGRAVMAVSDWQFLA